MSKLSAIHITKHTGSTPKHKATVIFFHGSGATGDHMREWVSLMSKNFSFPHIKIAYPTAPLQPYTPAGGMKSNVWFDRADISPYVPEKLESLKQIQVDVQNMIKQENKSGIPTNRIIVGATGDHMREWVSLMSKNFSFPHIKIAYPTAPLQPYTPAGGMKSNVWFDRADISPYVPEKLESLKQIQVDVQNMIKQENKSGIPTNRIIVGGFSMGGALALHTAYRWERDVAGVFAFSSFLNDKSVVYQDLRQSSEKLPPLLQIHGDSDDLVDLSWGQTTFNELKASGVRGEFHVMERLGHSINKQGLHIIKEWIERLLPDS